MAQPKDDSRLERRSMQVREFRAEDNGKIVGYAAVFDETTNIGGCSTRW